MGTTTKIILISEGVTKGRKFKAVQTGGHQRAVGILRFLDTPIDYR